MLFLVLFSSGAMPPKKRNKGSNASVGEGSNSSVDMTSVGEQSTSSVPSSPRKKRKQATSSHDHQVATSSALPIIDYSLLAKHILEQQKMPANESGIASHEEEQVPTCTMVDTDPESPSGLMNSALNSSANSSNHQASAMVPASALGALLDDVFTGESAGSTLNNGSQIQLTDCVPLGATVSAKLKLKIWNNEFVELKSLLPNSNEEPLSIMVKAGKIELQQASSNKNPITIHQWTDAFLIFISIYLQKFPQEASNLLKYMYTIREINKLHGEQAWRNYDETFRKIRETSLLPWERVVPELRLKAASMGFRSAPKSQGNFGKRQPFRVRHCFAYNRGQKCGSHPCRFSHTCQDCNGSHPRLQCTNVRFNSTPSIRGENGPSNTSKSFKSQK